MSGNRYKKDYETRDKWCSWYYFPLQNVFSISRSQTRNSASQSCCSLWGMIDFYLFEIWNILLRPRKIYPCFMSPDQKIRVSRSEIFFIFKSQNMCVIMREMVSFLTWSRVHLSVMFCFSVYIHRCLLGDYDDSSLISLQAWLTHTVSSTDDEVLVP